MSGWTVDQQRIVVGKLLRGGNADAVYLGTQGDKRYLVTLSTKHTEAHESIRRRMAFPFEGIAPLAFVGATDEGCPFADALVEELPDGHEAVPKLPEAAVAAIGIAVGRIATQFHAAGGVIAGIRPELIFVDDNNVFTTMAPRGPAFASSAPMSRGVRTYALPYTSLEALVHGQLSAASDVFGLAASLWFLASGAHPFGEQPMDVMNHLAGNQPLPWTGRAALGAILLACFAPTPSERPTARDLVSRLETIQ